MRHSSIGMIGAGILAGMVIGATGAVMMNDCRGLRGTKRSAKRAIHAFEDMLMSVKNMVF